MNLRKLPCLGIDNLFLDCFAIVLKNSITFSMQTKFPRMGVLRIQTQLLRLCVQSLNKNFDMII